MTTLRERLRTRGRKRPVPPRAVRVAKAPRAPTAASVIYQLRLRRAFGEWIRSARARLAPVATRLSGLEPGQEAPSHKEVIEALKHEATALAESASLRSAIDAVGGQVAHHSKGELARLDIKPKPTSSRVDAAEPKPWQRRNGFSGERKPWQRGAVRLDAGGGKEKPRPGIGIKLDPELRPLIEKWRTKNVDLITGSLHAQADKIAEVLANSEGSRHEVIAKRLEERFGITTRRAELIARDQVLTLNAQITQHKFQSAGIGRYIWTTTGDERVRGDPDGPYADSDENHFDLDGKTFSWDDPPVVNSKTGETAHPGEGINCRCQPYPLLDELADEEQQDEPTKPEPEAPAPEPEHAPAEPESTRPVLERQALKLADALRPTAGGRVADAPAARRLLRDQIAESLPAAASKDLPRAGGADLTVDTARMKQLGAHAMHEWSGEVVVQESVLSTAREVLQQIASGEHLAPGATKRAQLRSRLDSVRVLVHEELHGHSGVTGGSYRSAGAVLEEVGTELNARKVVHGLAPDLWDGFERVGGAYQTAINDVADIVTSNLKLDRAGALDAMAVAHERSALVKGASFNGPDEAVTAWARELPGTEQQRRAIQEAVSRLRL